MLLNNINLTINKGQKVDIVGTSGNDKTTLTKLLLALYSPINSKIKINNFNHTSLSNETYRNFFQ
ncbi:hypothetical protein FACS189499_04610 [Clostridia bacterium]|nr:hypothetical protein FACS189499_04610 [Clostridia bacterium]